MDTTVTLTQTLVDGDSTIEAGTTGTVLGGDDLGQTWVSFKTSPVMTILYPFGPDELIEFTS